MTSAFGPNGETEPLDLLDVNLYVGDVWPLFDWLREEAPVYRDKNGLVFVSAYDDVQACSKDPDTFTSVQGNRPLLPNDDSFIHQDGRTHQARRGQINHLFTPQAIARLEGHVVSVVDRLLDGVIPDGTTEFMETVASKLPMQLIGEMIGLPEEYWDEVHKLVDVFTRAGNGPEWVTDEANEAFLTFGGIHMDLVDQRRENPKDDLLSLWIHATPDGKPMTDDQILWEHTMMVVGGSETTRNAAAGGLYMLWKHPDQRQWLIEHPEGMNNAIEEVLRWTTPFTSMSRVATKDTTIGGHAVAEGETVVLMYPPGNRDPRRFENPHQFDIRRSFKNRILTFGHGRHLCLGAHLARMEVRVMIEAMLRRAPQWEVGHVEWAISNYLRGPATMEMHFGPGAA